MARGDVRSDLVAAAERLFVDRGLDAVSLREVVAEAGATNASAIQYHFGGRSGLVRAVLDKHAPAVEARRHALLDAYEARGVDDLRDLAAAYVRPLATELDDPDGGPGYLQLLADLMNRPNLSFATDAEDPADSTARWRALVAPLLDPEAVRLHRRFVAMQFTLTDLARRARNRPDGATARYTSHLVDLVTAVLTAPLSDETRRLVDP
jgi:AcrR family transcriptional regulator